MTVNPMEVPATLLVRDLFSSILDPAEISLIKLSHQYRLPQIYRLFALFHRFMLSSFLFLFKFLPILFSSLIRSNGNWSDHSTSKIHYDRPSQIDGCGSSLDRALSQLLSVVTDLPVCSQKYEQVRCLAERLIDENENTGSEEVRGLNRRVLKASFTRTLQKLETAITKQGTQRHRRIVTSWAKDNRLIRIVLSMYGVAEVALGWFVPARCGETRWGEEYSAEKLAAELLWLAERMAAIGSVEDAASLLASASELSSVCLSADPRLQGCLVKLSGMGVPDCVSVLSLGYFLSAAFLMKEIKELREPGPCTGAEQQDADMKLLTTWLPLMCRAGNGAEAPVLRTAERAELVKVIEETVRSLEQEQQETVLSLWLHHYTHNPNTDWPNLETCYSKWYSACRTFLLINP